MITEVAGNSVSRCAPRVADCQYKLNSKMAQNNQDRSPIIFGNIREARFQIGMNKYFLQRKENTVPKCRLIERYCGNFTSAA